MAPDADLGSPRSAALLDLVAGQRRGVLAAIKRDGRPQLSVVSYQVAPHGPVRISTRAPSAKVANLRRDPRVSLQVTGPDGWSYAVAEGVAQLTPVCADPHDPVVDELVEIYRAIAGEHPDWDEFRAAMVAEERLVVSFAVERVYGLAGG